MVSIIFDNFPFPYIIDSFVNKIVLDIKLKKKNFRSFNSLGMGSYFHFVTEY